MDEDFESFKEVGTETDPLTWEVFKEKLKKLKTFEEEGSTDPDLSKFRYPAGKIRWLYRGQSNSTWGLETTLERYYKNELERTDADRIELMDYYRYLPFAISEMNGEWNRNFQELKGEDVAEKVNTFIADAPRLFELPYYDILVYLRHLGFPSPMLDWTKSPWVAVFFAFRHAKPDENVAIWAYCNSNSPSKSSGETVISYLKSDYDSPHPRHLKQQAQYTVCTLLNLNCGNNNERKWFFVSPHKTFKEKLRDSHIGRKFIIRGDQKKNVLKALFEMNINDYSLFDDEDSFAKTLAFKCFNGL